MDQHAHPAAPPRDGANAPALLPRAAYRRIRRFVLVLMAVLPVQFGVTYAFEWLYGVQMWPALVFPSFGRVHDVEGGFEVREPTFEAHFEDGSTAAVTLADLFGELPVSHRRVVAERTFPLAPGEEEAVPEPTRDWLRDRLRVLFHGREPAAFEAAWSQRTYRQARGILQPTDSIPLRTHRLSL